MGGLAREFRTPVETMRHVLDAAAASGMPTDPRLWLDAPPVSSYPACQAIKAAADQGLDEPYLRVVREGLMVDRVKLDNADALIGAARRVTGLDVERFAIDLHSAAIVEAFGADMERARARRARASGACRFPLLAARRGRRGPLGLRQRRPRAVARGGAGRRRDLAAAARRPGGRDALRAHRHARGRRRLRSARAAGRGRAVAAGRRVEAARRARPHGRVVESGLGLPLSACGSAQRSLPHRGEGCPQAEAGASRSRREPLGLVWFPGLIGAVRRLQRRARPATRLGRAPSPR